MPESTTNTLYLTDSLQGGSSFGGLCRENGRSDQLFGITAAHCLENPIPEVTAVTVPSTLEINARSQCIFRYTTQSTEKVHQKASKERHAGFSSSTHIHHPHWGYHSKIQIQVLRQLVWNGGWDSP